MLYRACTQPGRLLAKHKKERGVGSMIQWLFRLRWTVHHLSILGTSCYFFFSPLPAWVSNSFVFFSYGIGGCKKENGVEPSNWNESSYGVSLYANIRMTKWVLERRRKHVNDGDFMENKKKCAWQGQISHIVHLLLLLLLLMLWRWNVKPLACWCRED